MNESRKRFRYIVRGQVQGVGFRPFVWRLAQSLGLAGHVANTSAGALIEIEGPENRIQAFRSRLKAELPQLAAITSIEVESLPLQPENQSFDIHKSREQAAADALITPDAAVCKDCLDDMRDPENPRHNYAFTNCTNCGPRFSITSSIPYDRTNTSMRCFPMCPRCKSEYEDPANRRFHAQPVACPDCGPQTWFVTRESAIVGQTRLTEQNCRDAIQKAGQAILKGRTIALRGLGGFQLACDARNAEAVARLRQRKDRPHKALAVMSRNLEETALFCVLDAQTKNLLASSAAPIVLCGKAANAPMPLADNIAPDAATIGVMLTYTPLHALLLDWLNDNGLPAPALVMTSANPAGEPICLGNREAISRLGHLADAWLLHNRDILCRVDDSVMAKGQNGPLFIRRSRGFAPTPVNLGQDGPAILGAGAFLKTAICLTRRENAFLSQHIGDLSSPATLEFYEQVYDHLRKLLQIQPAAIAHDLHPDFHSTSFARQLGQRLCLPVMTVQHHLAHAAACLADNNCHEPALAICLDGFGLGADGSAWGGELLQVDLRNAAWIRLGHLAPFPLPGGDKAVREPWRIATALAWQNESLPENLDIKEKYLTEMLERGVNCPPTSSCGRLFDAMAAMLGFITTITYEGQAAIRLETAARKWVAGQPMPQTPPASQYLQGAVIDSQKLFADTAKLRAKSPFYAAACFHDLLAKSFAQLACEQAAPLQIGRVALTGGCLQNRLLEDLLVKYLRQMGLMPLTHSHTPPGDGGIALGQAVWGRQLILNDKYKFNKEFNND